MSTVNASSLEDELVEVLDRAAETFAILASPVRLRILQAVCDGERSVSEIVTLVGQSQTNVSQHLALMYRGGVLTRRRSGTQQLYAVADPHVIEVCRAVCTNIAAGSRPPNTSSPPTASRRRSRG